MATKALGTVGALWSLGEMRVGQCRAELGALLCRGMALFSP